MSIDYMDVPGPADFTPFLKDCLKTCAAQPIGAMLLMGL